MQFITFVNRRHRQEFCDYNDIYEWSIENISEFWSCVWEFCGIRASRRFDVVVDDANKMPGAKWFAGARLNFAENLLRFRDERTALISRGEGVNTTSKLTYAELYESVAQTAKSLRNIDVCRGDRVVGLMPNIPETVIAMLATASCGAVWSACSPEFGNAAVVDRFGQIAPKVIFGSDGYHYQGRTIDCLDRIANIVGKLPSVTQVVIVPHLHHRPRIDQIRNSILYRDFQSQEKNLEIHFEQIPSEDPVYIMYSSGTTGLPKCMIHSAAGVLLQHMKDLQLHTDVKRDDVIFFYTTCGWMMWNWLISSLAFGATVTLYDGSPRYPEPDVLWKLPDTEKITIFGASAGYFAALEKNGAKPRETYDLSRLRTVLSTGSPLPVESFRYVYRDIKQDVQLASISGGTDINGCFALGNPLGPVYAGELQCRGLGMKVQAYDVNGRSVIKQKGDLVCTRPSPSMPISFWDDEVQDQYRNAYFKKFPNVWTHGDYIEITDDGGVIVYGRSDATLNPGGVRIGTAEIYRQVEALPEIADSLAVSQDWQGGVRVLLFVKMVDGVSLTSSLIEKIKNTIRENTSPRHVPAKIISVTDIPYTMNMKKVELAVRNVIHGELVTNIDSLINPESLDLYKDLQELRT